MAEQLSDEEIKQRIEEKKLKRKLKKARCRGLKNFCIWLAGVLCLPFLLVAAIAIAGGVVPLKTYFGDDAEQYVDVSTPNSIGNQPAFAAVTKIKDYKVKDVPVLEKALRDIFSSVGIDDYVTVDLDAMSDISLGAGEELTGSILSCFYINDTVLGDDTGVSFLFQTEEVGKTAGEVKAEENFDQKKDLYYYRVSASGGDARYERAFTDGGDYADGVTSSTALYYPSCSLIPIGELSIITERLKVVKLADIVTAFSDSDEQVGMLYDVIGDLTIGTLDTLDMDDFKISAFFKVPEEEPENKTMYDLLLDVTGFVPSEGLSEEELQEERAEAYRELSLADLNGFDPMAIHVTSVLPLENNDKIYNLLKDMSGAESVDDIKLSDLTNDDAISNIKLAGILEDSEQLYDILCDATGVADKNELTIGKLQNISITGIKLSSVLDVPTEENGNKNKLIYDIICDMTDKAADEITVNDFADLAAKNIKLSVVLSAPTAENGYENQKIYDILCAATDKDASEITINDLSGFDVNDVKLSVVLDAPTAGNGYENQKIYDILCSATDKDASEITINDLSGFDAGGIKLSLVLDAPTAENSYNNQKIYDILCAATGVSNADSLKVSDLSSFNVENVGLTTVLEKTADNEKLFTVLKDVTGKDADEIKISDLGSFDVNAIRIKPLVDAADNKILKALLSEDDGSVTLGNIGEKIDGLKISDVYDTECFVISNAGKYYKTAKGFVWSDSYNAAIHGARVDGKKYAIASTASVWLFMLYDVDGKTSDGNGTWYKESDLALKDLNSDNGIESMTTKLQNASVRQLVDAGIIQDPGYTGDLEILYASTLHDILTRASV